jgi:predicted nucleic acid-binding protein
MLTGCRPLAFRPVTPRRRVPWGILDLFETHVAEGFYRRIALSSDHYLRARQLIASKIGSLHTLDALHLAAAISESLPVMTADRDLAKAAKRHKRPVILIK